MSFPLLVLAGLYSASVSYASHEQIYVPQHETCGTPVTYAMITPSPEAAPYPITKQGQKITSYVPEYAVCNPDNSDCTTIYSTHTYNWCSTVIPCYGSACTVTDCAQAVTFSHENSYALQKTVCPTAGEYTIHGTATHIPSPTTVYYVQPIVTKYALAYLDYAVGRYDNVEVEKCVEIYPGKAVCEAYVEHWVEEAVEKEKEVIIPVTMHTYCPEPTTITCAGEIVVVDRPMTYTYVTERTETFIATEIQTRRTSTLTSTITLSRSYPTIKPESTIPCNTTYGPATTPTFTIQEHYTTTTESCSDTTLKPTYITSSRGTTSTITLTKTSTITTSRSSATSTPQKREEPAYPAPRKPNSTKPSYRAGKPRKPPTYVYSKDAAEAGYKQSGSAHNYGEYADESKQEEKSQALYSKTPVKARAEYAYEAACAGEADGSVHSYGQYADHEEGYKCSQSGYARKGVAYPVYKAAGSRYKAEPEYSATKPEYKSAEPKYKVLEPEYKAVKPGYKAVEPEYKAVEPEYKAAEPEYKAAEPEYKAAEPEYKAAEPEYKAAEPEYKAAEPEYKAAEPEYKAAEPEYKAAEPRYQGVKEGYKVKGRRDEYAYEAAGAGRADGQAHRYGQYADHEEEYQYSQDGYRKEGTGFPGYKLTKPGEPKYNAVEPKYKDVERRDESAYATSGSGNADGQVHSYGQYADHEEEYQYSQDEYSKKGPAPAYRKAKTVAARDDYGYEESATGRASGEIHSYGQYADYSEEYDYSQDGASRQGSVYRKSKPVTTTSASGEASQGASGERHSYGQYADYEKDASAGYKSEEIRYKPNRKGRKKGDNSYSYGVEKNDRENYY